MKKGVDNMKVCTKCNEEYEDRHGQDCNRCNKCFKCWKKDQEQNPPEDKSWYKPLNKNQQLDIMIGLLREIRDKIK